MIQTALCSDFRIETPVCAQTHRAKAPVTLIVLRHTIVREMFSSPVPVFSAEQHSLAARHRNVASKAFSRAALPCPSCASVTSKCRFKSVFQSIALIPIRVIKMYIEYADLVNTLRQSHLPHLTNESIDVFVCTPTQTNKQQKLNKPAKDYAPKP